MFVLPFLRRLLLGRLQRRQEERADLFAANLLQDPELLIRTLVNLHRLNSAPHTLRTLDETLSTHPSLKNRVAALRRHFGLPDAPLPET